MTEAATTFDDCVQARLPSLTTSEAKVAAMFRDNREEVLFASAAALAARAGTSDATVIRTAKALGFEGMDDLRRVIAAELKRDLSQASRLAATLGEVGGDLARAFSVTLDVHVQAISDLRRVIPAPLYERAVSFVAHAPRVVVFGIGPSSHVAEYLSLQLRRFGLRAATSTSTGLLAADALRQLEAGDRLVVMAYGRVYPELAVLLDEADRMDLRRLLLTDTLPTSLKRRFDIVLPVARGRADMLSMHTATLALVEALLVGVATVRPSETMASLRELNALRKRLAGRPMDLPTSEWDTGR